MTDDLLEIPLFLRRTEEAPRRRVARSHKRRLKLPASAKTKRKKCRGHPARLRALGYRPVEIRALTRREAEEIVAAGLKPARK